MQTALSPYQRIENDPKISLKHSSRRASSSFPKEPKKEGKRISKKLQEEAETLLQQLIGQEKLQMGALPPSFSAAETTSAFTIEQISGVELPAEVMELFEKSVNAMAHQMHKGVSETTFYLDAERFQGAKVVITEFNTAPKAFNISLSGTPEIAALFGLHAAELITAFQKSPFQFTVHRLESKIETDTFTRKESVGDENQDEGNES